VRNIFLKKLFIFVLLLSFTFIVGCDGKAPEEGYISKDDVTKDIISNFENSEKRLNEIRTERIKLSNLKNQLLPYSIIDESMSSFNDTKSSKVFFGNSNTTVSINTYNKRIEFENTTKK
jgi:hypothetical protein